VCSCALKKEHHVTGGGKKKKPSVGEEEKACDYSAWNYARAVQKRDHKRWAGIWRILRGHQKEFGRGTNLREKKIEGYLFGNNTQPRGKKGGGERKRWRCGSSTTMFKNPIAIRKWVGRQITFRWDITQGERGGTVKKKKAGEQEYALSRKSGILQYTGSSSLKKSRINSFNQGKRNRGVNGRIAWGCIICA